MRRYAGTAHAGRARGAEPQLPEHSLNTCRNNDISLNYFTNILRTREYPPKSCLDNIAIGCSFLFS